MVYRYGFLLLEKLDIMWKAAQCRVGFNGFKRTIKTMASIAVGIFISSINAAEKAQIALDCRNYQGYFPVYKEPSRANLRWVIISILTFI